MSGFESDSPEQALASLGGAAEELRVTVEEKLYEIVETAEARAHEIEDRALERALEIEQESERKAAEVFERSTEQAKQMMAAIDAFERELSDAVLSLRQKGAALAEELEAVEAQEAPIEAEAEAAPLPEPPETLTEEDPREGVRRRILDLFLAGRPRAEAEQLLGEIEDGGRYIDLLDEIYEPRPERQQGSRRRRGGKRRRRPGP
jgi:chromosome segregation ATPase